MMSKLDLTYPFDPYVILKKKKSIKRELLASDFPRIIKKIAILGGSTTNEIKSIMELFLLNHGIEPIFYESEYAQYWQETMFGEKLREFTPDVVFIHTTCRNITTWPTIRDSKDQIDALLDVQFLHFTSMWDKLVQDLRCPIIQNNFERPGFRMLGNRDISDFHGRTNFVFRLNQKFYEYAQENEGFYINDIDYLSACYGLERWLDPLAWHIYKYALSVSAIPELAFSVASIIKAIYGKNKKAIVLDLDNTLWGGVVGDDGLENLTLGAESAIGQTYREFQEYIKIHKDLGVILTICSKNDYENAIAGLNHPDGVLSPEDFVLIKADWENKDSNVLRIADELNIGVDSLVFVDDNPAERELVVGQIQGIAAPNIGKVEDYIQRLDRSGFFEVTTVSADDIKRSEMYKKNSKRAESQQRFQDYAEYLKSLDMVATIRDFEPVYYQRITQLTNKTNQFNLTTKRYSENEIASVAKDENYIRLYGRLEDKFGDNGVVSLIIGEKDSKTLHINLWLMSCRVLKRDMELAMFDCLVEEARGAGLVKLVGYYYPTGKNSIVREFYKEIGFSIVNETEKGDSIWEYLIGEHENRNTIIAVNNL